MSSGCTCASETLMPAAAISPCLRIVLLFILLVLINH
jgi:hypothetical protein